MPTALGGGHFLGAHIHCQQSFSSTSSGREDIGLPKFTRCEGHMQFPSSIMTMSVFGYFGSLIDYVTWTSLLIKNH